MLYKVELWVELWWNYMKFHPNSTHNSTTNNLLIIKAITTPRWKGGTSNDKKYFSENMAEKVLTAVKNKEKYSWYTHFQGFFFVYCWISLRLSGAMMVTDYLLLEGIQRRIGAIQSEFNPCSEKTRRLNEHGFYGYNGFCQVVVLSSILNKGNR